MTARLLTVLLTLGLSQAALADSVTGMLGFTKGAVNLGAQYEHEMSQGLGLGGMIHMATDDEDASVPEIMSFVGHAKIHFNPLSDKVGFYVAPGVGIHMYDNAGNDETYIGPTLQYGVVFHMSQQVSLGVENYRIFNWLSDEAPYQAEYLNAVLVYNM